MPETLRFEPMYRRRASHQDRFARLLARASKFANLSKARTECAVFETASLSRALPSKYLSGHIGNKKFRPVKPMKDLLGMPRFDPYSEKERLKQRLRAARFGTAAPSAGVPVAQTSKEEQSKKRRAAKYGLEYTNVDRSGINRRLIMEAPSEASAAAEPRPDTIHVYGVDLLSTRDLLTFFDSYNPSRVEWLNDSSCNVCFADDFSVKRLIAQTGEALADEEKYEAGGVQS